MRTTSRFAQAFWSGMAAPVNVYAAPAPYLAYVATSSLATSFVRVGQHIGDASGRVIADDERTVERP